jgi:HSP20 family protein
MQPTKSTSPTPPKVVPAADLLTRVQRLRDSVARRAFEISESRGRAFGRDLENWLEAESELLHPVHVDVAESDEGLTIRAEVPGFKAEQLEVGVEPRRVTIAGKRETHAERKDEKTIYKEHCSDRILRVIELPAEVVAGKVAASLSDGVLELKMPKAAPAKKVIPIGPYVV